VINGSSVYNLGWIKVWQVGGTAAAMIDLKSGPAETEIVAISRYNCYGSLVVCFRVAFVHTEIQAALDDRSNLCSRAILGRLGSKKAQGATHTTKGNERRINQ
jgi:hypothetical protein